MLTARSAVACAASALFLVPSASAQFDPRPTLATLISAFQQCGPPQAYQSLAPVLWQTVYMQTGGTGCYAQVASAGAAQDMQIVERKQFPIGPLYVVRVQHQAGIADWFIGFNQATGRVEYLTFQAAQQTSTPTTTAGPAPSADGPSTGSGGGGNGGGGGSGDGCDLYPAMCQ
jgi:hypothetical protein